MLDILLNEKSLGKQAEALVAAANDAGGNDNITAVLVQNNNQPILKVALKPPEKKHSSGKNQPDKKSLPREDPELPVRRKRGLLVLLTLVPVGLLAMVLFQKTTPTKNNIVLNSVTAKPKNEKQDRLISSADDSTKTYQFPPAALLVSLSRPVLINKDSFYIKGNGTTIICDSNYRGPAVTINKTAKAVVLDSIVFSNFDVGIVVQKNNVVFKNVKFINCRVPVEYQLSLPDTVISGCIKDSIFIPFLRLKKSK